MITDERKGIKENITGQSKAFDVENQDSFFYI